MMFPAIIFATSEGASIGENYFNFTDISVAQDLSMNLLAMIFGSFGGMLPAAGTSVLSPLFEYFNQGVFYIAAGMVAYTAMLSTIKTSEEGKAMGERTSSSWMLFRPIIGTSLLVPGTSGYSMLQSFMMWAVISGVSFANSLWYSAVDVYNTYGSLGVATDNDSSDPSTLSGQFEESNTLARYLLQSELCLLHAKDIVTTQDAVNIAAYETTGTSASSYTPLATPSANLDYNNFTLTYENLPTVGDVVMNCGAYKFGKDALWSGLYNNEKYSDAQISAMLMNQVGILYTLVQSLAAMEYNLYSNINNTVDWSTSTDICQTTLYTYSTLGDLNCPMAEMLTSSGALFNSGINSVQEQTGLIADTSDEDSIDATTGGWLMAAAAYYKLVSGTAKTMTNEIQLTPDKTLYDSSGHSITYPTLCYDGTINTQCTFVIPEGFYRYISDDTTSPYTYSLTNWFYTNEIGSTGTTYSPNMKKYVSLYYNTYSSSGTRSDNTTFTPTSTFESVPSVNVNNLRETFSAQMYGSALNLFSGVSINSAFIDNLEAISKKTKSGIDLTATSASGEWELGNSGVNSYKYNNIPEPDSFDMDNIFNTTASSWDFSGSSDIFDDIYNNYIASLIILWENSFLGSDRVDPVGSVRDFGIDALRLSTDFLVSTAAKLYTQQMYILGKGLFYWALFQGLQFAPLTKINALLDKAADKAFATLLAIPFLAWLAYPVFIAIKGIALVIKMTALPALQWLGSVSLVVMQMELLGTFLWVPVLIATAVPIIALAMILAFYAPMIPFLIWTLAAINWLIGVIESMVAAPVVALGITSPQGHDFLGKAELFGMLVLAIFIRPAGMIFGFMFAVMIAYFGFTVMNYMIFYTMQIYLSSLITGIGGKAAAVILIGMLFLYCYIILTCITQIFSMIYVIPNKIMRWIGVPVDQPDEDRYLEEIKGGVSNAGQSLGSSASQGSGQFNNTNIYDSGTR